MKFGYREGLFVAICCVIGVAIVVWNIYLKDRHEPYPSCLDVTAKVSGKYNISGRNNFSSFEAYCEMEKNGGGWMVIQHRFDGSLNFERNWTEYRKGFGDVEGEHWLGLEKVYQATKEHGHELLMEFTDLRNTYYYMRYSSFGIASEIDHYRLVALGVYSGTVKDMMHTHSGMMFSTPDRDNDALNGSCANVAKSGWWFKDCGKIFLNSPFGKDTVEKEAWKSFNYTRMLIRRLH